MSSFLEGTMRRAEFSKLTGLNPQFFNSLARRDQFPFLRRALADGPGWGNYSPKLAYLTLLSLALADAGATQTEAGHFVDTEFELLVGRGVHTRSLQKSNIYLGYARLGSSEMDHEAGRFTLGAVRRPMCGFISDLLIEITRLEKGGGLLGVVLVNASEQLRVLRDRGIELGLDEDLLSAAFSDGRAEHEG